MTAILRIFYFAFFACLIGCKDQKNNVKHPGNTRIYANDLNKLIKLVENDSLNESQLKSTIPGFIIDFLSEVGNEKFIIADSSNLYWNATDAKLGVYGDSDRLKMGKQINSKVVDSIEGKVTTTIPNKKLISFAIGKNTAYISFIQGGFAGEPKLYVFSFSGEKVIDYWASASKIPILSKQQCVAYMEEKL